MFSSMTIASSTTKPTESVSASNVMLLVEKTNAYISAQGLATDNGTASEGMTVAAAERRNRKITSTTSAIAMPSVTSTSSTEARMETERSIRNCMAMDAGTWAR